ncbi:MAG: DNA invertase [Hyphomicrobiales bacterium]|nr:recombinase family protein [Candidatus Eremiobacteraeota bacterium]PZR81523.1 MAG: DNA invertase [Hyphomicrobiales bacterium]
MQRDALETAHVEKSYEDTASGKSLDRPQLAECLRSLRQGDTLIVWRLDRLGRSVKDLVALINELRERGVEFVSLTEAIDTTTPMGSFIFHITAALAELERSIIRERTRAGLASARARGHKGGRPRKLNDREWRAVRTLVDARELTIAEIAVQYHVSPATIYRRLSS